MRVIAPCDYEPFLLDDRYSDQEKLDKYLRLRYDRPDRCCFATISILMGDGKLDAGRSDTTYYSIEMKLKGWRNFGMNCSVCPGHLKNLFCVICGGQASESCACETTQVRGPIS